MITTNSEGAGKIKVNLSIDLARELGKSPKLIGSIENTIEILVSRFLMAEKTVWELSSQFLGAELGLAYEGLSPFDNAPIPDIRKFHPGTVYLSPGLANSGTSEAMINMEMALEQHCQQEIGENTSFLRSTYGNLTVLSRLEDARSTSDNPLAKTPKMVEMTLIGYSYEM